MGMGAWVLRRAHVCACVYGACVCVLQAGGLKYVFPSHREGISCCKISNSFRDQQGEMKGPYL